MFQEENNLGINDMAVANDFSAIVVGNGEVIVFDLSARVVKARWKMSDIKLLNCFIVNSTATSFDILAANGRSELLKATFNVETSCVE